MGIRFGITALAMAATSTAANAEWQRAESSHYIVYGDMSTPELRAATAKFEKYAFVLRTLSGLQDKPKQIKLKIYLVRNIGQVQTTMAYPSEGVAGYFVPNVRGSMLIAPRLGNAVRATGDRSLDMDGSVDYNLVAYHELAHDFMFQNFAAAYPTWYSEGFADFYGTYRLQESDKADTVQIGLPQAWRVESIRRSGEWLPVQKLLSARSYADVGDSIGALYSQGWLLVHYAANNKERGTQLKQYLGLINGGASYADAAKRAFGNDTNKLDAEMKSYARGSKINMFVYPFKKIDPGQIDIHALTPAETALWQFDLKLTGGVAKADSQDFAADVRRRAANYPTDPYALQILTETELLVGKDQAAADAAARWVAVAPRDPLASMNKGLAGVRLLKAEKVPAGDPRWGAARKNIAAAYRLDPDQPRVLKAYYDSYTAEGVLPPISAQNTLMKALDIVPGDDDLRREVALDFEARDLIPEAIAVIKPLAYAIKPDKELTPQERARRDKAKKQYGIQGEQDDGPSAREMLIRFEKKLPKPPADATAATPPA